MISPAQERFLLRSYGAAVLSSHPFPDYAACETALESKWGFSKLAIGANNLFGQKRDPSIPLSQCIYCDTREEGAHGHWYTEDHVPWPKFANWTECYNARLALLKRLSSKYPEYAAALEAKTGEEFVLHVSRTWSTWTQRAATVLAIYKAHGGLLGRMGGAIQ